MIRLLKISLKKLVKLMVSSQIKKKNKTMIILAMLHLKVGVVEDKVVVSVELIFQIFLKIFLEILVVGNQEEGGKLTIEGQICDMIYLLLSKRPMKVKNKI